MMTSVGSSRARGSWEQTQTQNQTQHKQRPQATAEQIRLAQMISDHNDADFEEKVKQLIDITGKDQDESMIALHDCNGDINRAINVLLEGSPDTDSWEMVGKKKGVSGQKESGHVDVSEEGKENRDRGGERDVARRRGGAPRRGRGASRGREFRGQENGLDGGKVTGSAARGTERGRRGRGRGGRGNSLGSAPFFVTHGFKGVISSVLTFNPADYAEPAQADESYAGGSTWNNTGSLEPDDSTRLEFTGIEGTNYPRKFDSAPGAWRTAPEEWGTEDWNEDLSETKIFTASSVAAMSLPQESVTITAGQRIDLAVLLGKTPPSSSSEAELTPLEASQPPSLSQALVFNNSKQGGAVSQPPSSAPYTHMLSKSFGDVVDPKATSGGSTSGSQFLEQFKTAQALAQLAAQHTQTGSTAVPSSSWDTSASLGQYGEENNRSDLYSGVPTSSVASSMIDAFLQEKVPPSSVASSLHPQTAPAPTAPPALPLSKPPAAVSGQQMSPVSSDNQSSSPQPLQQHKLKQQKKRTSISTKIPALAVEMPGTADISGLNLQFGALQFGSEPVLTEYEVAPVTTAPASQTQSSLYTSARKAPPNLPPGVPPLLPNPYIMAPGLLHAYPVSDYYSIPFATPTTALTGREGSLTSNPYSAELTKFGRGEAPSPAPATTLAQPQQSQTQTHHTTQQPFLNPALPPGYSYTSLPYYTGVPGLPNTFQYGPAVFPVAPTSSKQHGVNVSVNASATPFQQASGYGSHGYGTGVSVTSSNTGVPDISGSVYTKTQSFDKQGFHAGTPAASFSLPSALGSGGPINPPAAAGYAPAPFMHILAPHQQPHSQILHHHLQQDGQVGLSQSDGAHAGAYRN
uniref:Ubiquitin associated protein 2-like n=1 Tax=Scleropages formosus TaxID=113540 RepID=A0A8C9T4Y2_SCLFO